MFLLCYDAESGTSNDSAACSHAYGMTSGIDATCTQKGSVEYQCSKCGDTYTEEIAPVGHQYSDGKCTVCGSADPSDKPVKVVHDNQDTPDEIGGTLTFEASVQAGHVHYYNVYRVSGTYLTISHKDAYVIYNGVTYGAKNGVVTVPGLQSNGMNDPVQLAIGNRGSQDVSFSVVMAYPAGTQMNPHTLNLGSITTKVEAGNDQGVFYTYTATKSGVLTLTLVCVSNNEAVGITMFNKTTSRYVTMEEIGVDYVSVNVEKGQTVSIIISTLPDENFRYPAATIETTASIA